MRLIILSLLLCACNAAQERQTDVRVPASDVELRSDLDGRPIAAEDENLDSTGAAQRLAEMQAVADTATVESVASLALLRAGLLKLRLYPADIMGDVAAKRPQDFFHNEIAGGWLYNGADLDTLLGRYPTSVLADDARYARLFLIPGGECEGRADCIIGWAQHRRIEFLKSDPSSRHASAVIAMINQQIRLALAEVVDLRTSTESYDALAVRGHLAAYDSVIRRLPPPLRDPAIPLLDSIWARFGGRD